jgi:hypothetical protein
MSALARYLNRYRLFWLALLAVFCLFVYWLLFIRPAGPLYTEVDPDDVKTVALDDQQEDEPTLDERAKPLQLNAEEAEFSISSNTGDLIMRLWAESAEKAGPVINVKEGVLQFEMTGGNSLLLRVATCMIRIEEDDLMTVSGDILGNIVGTEQYFSGSHLTWDRGANIVEVEEVYYVGEKIEVRGEQMNINMDPENVEVTFEGLVEAGV